MAQDPVAMLAVALHAAGALALGYLVALSAGRRTGGLVALIYAVIVSTVSSFTSGLAQDVARQQLLLWVMCAVVAVESICRARPGATAWPGLQQGSTAATCSLQQCASQQQAHQQSLKNQQEEQQLQHTPSNLQGSEEGLERPVTPEQLLQASVWTGTRGLSPVSDHGSALCQDGPCRQVEQWATLPDAVFADVMSRVAAKDIGNMRCVCSYWFDTAGRSITTLRPNSLPVLDLIEAFPSLQVLDLSNCTKDISSSKLRHLHELPYLEDLTLGCHHRLIASTVTDTCLAELVGLTNLKHLNLSQCVHVRDAGMMSLMNLPTLASLNISGCVAITDIGIMMIAQLTNLTSLEMPWCLKVTNIGLSALTQLTKLANLNISGCQLISEHGIACLGTLTNLQKLGLLNLGYSKVCVTDAALRKLSGLTKLESLNLGLNIGSMQPFHKGVTDDSLALISSRFRQLTQLGLMSLDISDEGVKKLAQLSRLQALNLRGCCRVTGACLQQLSSLTKLTDLCLLHNPNLAVDDGCVASLAKLPSLKILGLGNYQVHNTVSDSCLVPLANTKQLLVLSLAFFKGRFAPQACSVLAGMSQLQHLDLQGSVHADAALMQAVCKLDMLQSLHLSRCDLIDDAALQHITGLSKLHTLNISMCSKVSDVGLAAVTKLQDLTHLLAQHCRAITDSGVALLGRLTELRVLDLSMCERVTGSGFLAFGGCTQMATLSLNGCSSLNDSGLRAVGRITSLSKLDLSNCRLVSDVGVACLVQLHELTGLDLAMCELVGDAALAVIAAHMHQLATLKVNGCGRVTDAGLAHVCNIASLLTLHLDRCIHITDVGLKHLTRLHGLTSLRISRCPYVTDTGVAQLSKLSRLSTLSLAQCPLVTDVGLMSLAPLTTLASLEF